MYCIAMETRRYADFAVFSSIIYFAHIHGMRSPLSPGSRGRILTQGTVNALPLQLELLYTAPEDCRCAIPNDPGQSLTTLH